MSQLENQSSLHVIATDAAVGIVPVKDRTPITVIGNNSIRAGFDAFTLQQAVNARLAPGVSDVVLNPDAHRGYGAPIGCVMVSPTHIYPGPVGVDIKCSMSLLQMNIPADEIRDQRLRRALIEAIGQRLPTGAGRRQRHLKKGRKVGREIGFQAVTEGASPEVCYAMGIPADWVGRCEDAYHVGHDLTTDALRRRLDLLLTEDRLGDFDAKLAQFGSYGGGNHFGECEVVSIANDDTARHAADAFGLRGNHVAFLSHCGSRGLGHKLASGQFRALQDFFSNWSIPLPGQDRDMVYAPLGTSQANDYIDDMSLGANFATINHLVINALVLEAFQEVLPGTTGSLVYFISHNIARLELLNGRMTWVHRKGATRAFPAGHPGLKGTAFDSVGHPILLPGNPREGSVVMVATPGAAKSCYSVNHGAGRALGRKDAARKLNQATVDEELARHDILTNCRTYPIDEAPDAYKDFAQVLASVEQADLARPVAKLTARFVIKDGDKADD